MKRFVANVVFQTWDEARQAEDELRAAGYEIEITDDVDIYSPATWLRVARASDVDLWGHIESTVDPLDGLIEEGGLE